jgi:hypothetical protein
LLYRSFSLLFCVSRLFYLKTTAFNWLRTHQQSIRGKRLDPRHLQAKLSFYRLLTKAYNHVKIQIITHTLSHVLNYNKPPLEHASDGSYALQLALKQQ